MTTPDLDADLDELIAALDGLDADGVSKTTSLRLPDKLHRAVLAATRAGMDPSLTAATTAALADRLRAFLRSRALAGHFARFPGDIPSLAEVALRRVEGSDHPGAKRPDLVEEVANWVEVRRPDWGLRGAVDESVDLVLDHVEMLCAGIGVKRRRSA